MPQKSDPTVLLPMGAMLLGLTAAAFAQAQSSQQAADKTSTAVQPAPVETIEVTAANEKKSLQPGLTIVGKVPALPRDIPQSLTIVTEKLITDQARDSLKGALQNVPGITFEAGEGGRIGDNIRLRGFTVAGDIYLDGMRDIAQYNRETFNVDRVEVLRGSSSMLFGRGSTGGIVNQVSKTAQSRNESEVTTTVGAPKYARLIGDFNVKTGDDQALRANVMVTDGQTRAEGLETDRKGAALNYRMGIGHSQELSLSYQHLHYSDVPDFGFRWIASRPAPAPSAERWYGVASDYQRDRADIATMGYTLRSIPNTTLNMTLRDGHYDRDLWATTAGAINGTTLDQFTENTVVTRGNQTRAGKEHHTFAQLDGVTKFQAFAMKHELLFGSEYALERSVRFNYTTTPSKPNTTVGAPSNDAVLDTRTPAWANTFRAATSAAYLQDTIEFAPSWKAMIGARFDRFEGDYARSTGGPLARADNLWSKRAGLIYEASPQGNIYVSYGTSFNTSGDLYQYDPTTANTPAEGARNYELGTKWDLLDDALSVRASLARSIKTNERSTDTTTVPGGDGYLLSGQRHADALEVEVAGRINPKWEVFAGFVLTRAQIDKAGSSANAQATVGLNPGLTPAQQANLWMTYQYTSNLRFGGGIVGVSQNKPAAAETTTNRTPGYAKIDALIEYQWNAKHTFKLNVENLTDRVYYPSLYRNFLVPGAPRNVKLTWVAKF